MLRLLVDPLGDGHRDIVLKLDATPGMARIADSYYLPAFLGISDEENADLPMTVLKYIEYLEQRTMSSKMEQTFLPFEFDDHYIGGILLTSARKGLLNARWVRSDTVTGWNVMPMEANFDGVVWKWENDGEWLLSLDSILQGLDWSKRTIIESK